LLIGFLTLLAMAASLHFENTSATRKRPDGVLTDFSLSSDMTDELQHLGGCQDRPVIDGLETGDHTRTIRNVGDSSVVVRGWKSGLSSSGRERVVASPHNTGEQ
jgi:hypothetical protein